MSIASTIKSALTSSKAPMADNLATEIAETASLIGRLEDQCADQARAALDESDTKAVRAYAQSLEDLNTAKTKLDKLRRAQRVALREAAEARMVQAKANTADTIKKLSRILAKRLDAATALSASIAEVVRHWRLIHETATQLKAVYPGGNVPGGSLVNPSDLQRAFQDELYRLGGVPVNVSSAAATRGGAPSLPGAVCSDHSFTFFPSRLPPLEDVVTRANQHMLRKLNGELAPEPPTVEHTEAAEGDDLQTALPPAPVAKTRTAAEIGLSKPVRLLSAAR